MLQDALGLFLTTSAELGVFWCFSCLSLREGFHSIYASGFAKAKGTQQGSKANALERLTEAKLLRLCPVPPPFSHCRRPWQGLNRETSLSNTFVSWERERGREWYSNLAQSIGSPILFCLGLWDWTQWGFPPCLQYPGLRVTKHDSCLTHHGPKRLLRETYSFWGVGPFEFRVNLNLFQGARVLPLPFP